MHRLTRDSIEQLVPYPPGKPIEELERELGITGGIVKLASNENALGPSPMAVEAITRHLAQLHRYPDGNCYGLKEALSRKFNLPPAQILVGNGSNELIEVLIRSFLLPGETALQCFPTFLVYDKMVRTVGAEIHSVPLRDFRPDPEALLDAVRASTKIVFLNNPNNPTGGAVPLRAVEAFLARLRPDVLVVLDEAYIEFATREDVGSGLEFLDRFPGLVVLRTFSKLYGLAGLRVGYGFASERIADVYNRVRQPFNVSRLAQAAAQAALADEDFVQRSLRLVREGLDYLLPELADLGLACVPTQTNFFLIRVPGGGETVYERMLKLGVIVRAMDSFGLPDYIRINVGRPEENERFVRSLRQVLAAMQ